MSLSPRIVFMGSPDFAVPALEALTKEYKVVGVVTQPDRPAGRGGKLKPPAVKEAALRLGLPVIQPGKLRQPEAMQQLRDWAPALIIVVAFGQILRPEVLDLPKFGCLNLHASLLPRWRGAAPIQAAILAGDPQTGLTIMKMDPGVDTGPLLSQRSLPIDPQVTSGSLFARLAPLGADLLLETLPPYLSGDLLPQPQPAEGATYAPMLKKEAGLLDLSQSAVALERRVRAYHPWPGTWIEWNGTPLKILRAHINAAESLEIGKHLIVDGLPALGTGEGFLILDELQPAGKKPMTGKSFLAGARGWGYHE